MTDTMTRVGEQISMLSLPTLDGTEVDLQTLQGKKVLLFMWGSW